MSVFTAARTAREAMPVTSHLREARTRAVRAAVAILLGVVAGYLLSDQILEILRTPIETLALSRDASLNYDSVTGAFDLKLKVALISGIILSSPGWLFQLFGFISPALTRREKAHTYGFFSAAVVLFIAGCVAGFVFFPHMVELLASFAPADTSTILNASYYVDFVLKIIVATGIAFVLPVVCVLLNFLGILPAATLTRSWRVIIVAIVTFSALVTPAADVLSMFLIATPMAGLFAIAVLIAHLHDRRIAHHTLPVAAEPAPESLPA